MLMERIYLRRYGGAEIFADFLRIFRNGEKAVKKAIAVLLMLVCAALALTGCANGREEKNTTKMTVATTRATTVQSTSETTEETTSVQTTAQTSESIMTTSDTGVMTTEQGAGSGTTSLVPDGLIPDMTTGGPATDSPVETNGSIGT